jgi:hypothetical protein
MTEEIIEEEVVEIEEKRTLRGVWNDWKNEVVNKALDSWYAIKEICKASFQLFKKPLIALIEGTYEWLKAVIIGVVEIVVALISLILITFSRTLVKSIWSAIHLSTSSAPINILHSRPVNFNRV